ncbi:MAG: pseudouridine synthase, partial [Clostridium sp.]|nr:pseudouridine synthase [Clostridium sp.]
VRIYPVGRLDKESDGLLLMTNRGELVNAILRARNAHEKEYVVTVNRTITRDFIRDMESGVDIGDTESGACMTRPCKVRQTGDRSFRIVLTQGLNRQIRRMCAALGYEVISLTRVRIMNIELKDLPRGQYREVAGEELRRLEELLRPEG